ncbi:MAG: serpin family protein [Gemmatimonadota bacterium]|nr:MAG: serpin family protein [Gemmatimonadota bacterium]
MLSFTRSTCLSLLILLAGGSGAGWAQQHAAGGGYGQLASAGNAFGFKLFREIHAQARAGENIFISPLSVAAALTMVSNGAAGATEVAMRGTLELGALDPAETNEGYHRLFERLEGLDAAVEFLPANSIWYSRDLEVKQAFLDLNREFFGAEAAAVDFTSPSTPPAINVWVRDRTGGRIADIVDAAIDPAVIMYLINAVYFNGEWTIQFAEELTTERPFRLADGGVKRVSMMTYPGPQQIGRFSDEDYEAIDLPYGAQAYSMTIVMPAAGADLEALVASLDPERWQEIVKGLSPTATNVLLPKFRLAYELEMSDVLKRMGMGIAFSAAAEFSKICDEGVFISRVKHKAFVDVREEGTEAAAATAVELKRGLRPTVLAVDRPFVFVIRERSSGAILFMGRVADPTASE